MIAILFFFGLLVGHIVWTVSAALPPRLKIEPALTLHPLPAALRAVVELSTALAFAAGYRLATWEGTGYAMLGAFFLLITLMDLRYRVVPNSLVYPGLALALVVGMLTHGTAALLGGAFALVIFGGTAALSPDGLGGGDVKLAVLIGTLFGFPNVIWALLVGGGVGALTALLLLLAHRRQPIPYAPFLCLGAALLLVVQTI